MQQTALLWKKPMTEILFYNDAQTLLKYSSVDEDVLLILAMLLASSQTAIVLYRAREAFQDIEGLF